MDAAEDAQDAAGDEDCDCDAAVESAEQTYDYAKKAYNAERFEDFRNYAHKGMAESEDITSNAEDCED